MAMRSLAPAEKASTWQLEHILELINPMNRITDDCYSAPTGWALWRYKSDYGIFHNYENQQRETIGYLIQWLPPVWSILNVQDRRMESMEYYTYYT